MFSPDGRLMATASWDKTARLVDVATRKEIARLAHNSVVSAVAFSPDGRLLATASGNQLSLTGEARLFDVASGKEIARLTHDTPVAAVSPHVVLVAAVAFSSDGKLVATASEDGMTRIFEVTKGKEVARLAHYSKVSAVAFSPDGATLATASADETARLWRVFPTPQALVDTAKAKAARCLTQAQRKQYFLQPAPPFWCVERRLWPYHGNNWQAWLPKQKAWLATGREGEAPPLPLAP